MKFAGVVAGAAVLVSTVLLSASTSLAAGVSEAGPMPPVAGQVMPPPPQPEGTFIPQPTYGNLGQALVVYTGGTVPDLELAASNAGAVGVWVQDVTGRFQLLPVRGPIFVQSGFAAAFAPSSPGAPNFARVTAVVLVR